MSEDAEDAAAMADLAARQAAGRASYVPADQVRLTLTQERYFGQCVVGRIIETRISGRPDLPCFEPVAEILDVFLHDSADVTVALSLCRTHATFLGEIVDVDQFSDTLVSIAAPLFHYAEEPAVTHVQFNKDDHRCLACNQPVTSASTDGVNSPCGHKAGTAVTPKP